MNLTILISAIGRRSQLIQCFRQAQNAIGFDIRVLGADASPEYAPAAYLTDSSFLVPPCGDPNFIQTIFDLCRRERVRLIVPTIDTELPLYAAHRREFDNLGVTVAVSSPETVRIAADKVETNRWLSEHGFPTVTQASPDEVLANPSRWRFPLVLKPRHGSASIGVQRILSLTQLEIESSTVRDPVVEEFAPGDEHTVNVYVNRNGKCLCAVPHRRIEVRSGEVSKGLTTKHGEMMELARNIAQALPGAWGALNIQCFLAYDGRIRVTEINARFGGGYPLAHHAGANFPGWLLQEVLGRSVDERFDEWQDGLLMLRHDTAVFVTAHGSEAEAGCIYRKLRPLVQAAPTIS